MSAPDEPPTTEPPTTEPTISKREARRLQQEEADAARRREAKAAAEEQAALARACRHRWIARMHNNLQRPRACDDEATMANYPAPEWRMWTELQSWDVAREAIPLLLGHDPYTAERPPYLNAVWCANNLGRREVTIVRLVVDAMGSRFGNSRTIPNTMNPGYLTILGYDTDPYEFVAWAKSKDPIDVPPPLLAWLDKKERQTALALRLSQGLWAKPATTPAVQPATTPAVLPSADGQATKTTWADVPLPGISDKKPEIRRAFVIYVAQRCAGLVVPPNKAGSVQLLGEYESTIANYTRDEAQFPKWYEPLREFAGKHPGGWGLVFEALGRRMHPLAD